MDKSTQILIAWYAACYAGGTAVASMTYRVLMNGGHVRKNFQGRDIAASLGVCFALLAMAAAPAGIALLGWGAAVKALSMLSLSCGFCVLGLLDDLLISRERGGFSGHFKRALKGGGMSTALIKAAFGLLLCGGVAVAAGGGLADMAVNALVIALSANAVNLLDVKPGRAIKGFVFAMCVLVGGSYALAAAGRNVSVAGETLVLLVPFVLWALATWKFDLGCRAMMGDAGSNCLGAMLGLALVWELSFPARAAALLLLIVYHLVSELGSISAIIQAAPPLRYLDNFGVKLLAPAAEDKANHK